METIPPDIYAFILEQIDSVAELEALMILRNDPRRRWTADALAKRLYSNRKQASDVLARLHSNRLITLNGDHPPQYNYQPQTDEAQTLVSRLAEIYRTHLVPVTNLIHSKARFRVQEFADAFDLRKDE